jgi:hypothetical protein
VNSSVKQASASAGADCTDLSHVWITRTVALEHCHTFHRRVLGDLPQACHSSWGQLPEPAFVVGRQRAQSRPSVTKTSKQLTCDPTIASIVLTLSVYPVDSTVNDVERNSRVATPNRQRSAPTPSSTSDNAFYKCKPVTNQYEWSGGPALVAT